MLLVNSVYLCVKLYIRNIVLFVYSLLLGGLCHLVNEARSRRYLSPDIQTTLTQILDIYVSQWLEQEAAAKAKEEEDGSLYKYKTEVHGDERSEEEQLEAEFRDLYPEFTQVCSTNYSHGL